MSSTSRRSFLKLLGCASATTPSLSFAKSVTEETNWCKGKIAKQVRYCGNSFKPDQKAYSFILMDEDGNGIVTFAPDALAHKKVIRHGFFIHKELGDKKELLVDYRIDSKYVVHLRLKK